jgi:metal-dependent amidase/aminoacylase/carboxypeptidase family protein
MGGIAAAIATGRALEKHGIAGKVVLLGTPAEEVYGGKCYMLQRGAYKDMEGCLMCVDPQTVSETIADDQASRLYPRIWMQNSLDTLHRRLLSPVYGG